LSRYTFEVGEHEEAKRLLAIAFELCTDHDSLLYAHFCNTAGVIAFELNHLQESRQSMEEALRIRREKLQPDDEELANSINNMGNIESAEGNIDRALELFTEAEDIRSKLGEEVAISLAVTYLTRGRALYLKKEFEEAQENYTQAETIAIRFAGRNSITVAL
jgi:tetratricopeptide (TPR) repeat protein